MTQTGRQRFAFAAAATFIFVATSLTIALAAQQREAQVANYNAAAFADDDPNRYFMAVTAVGKHR